MRHGPRDDGAEAIAADGANVYWTTSLGGTVMKVASSGGSPVVIASNVGPVDIAVDATSVYWSNANGSIAKATPK